VAFPQTRLDVVVQIALGADLTEHPGLWSWTDITNKVHWQSGITITRGRADEFSTAAPSRIALTLINTDGRFCPRNPAGIYYGQISRNTPLRVRVNAGAGYVTQALGFVDQWPVVWGDKRLTVSFAPVTASGLLRRLGQGEVQRSPLYRSLARSAYTPTAAVKGYWPGEDETGSTSIASGIDGRAAILSGGVEDFAADTTIAGSDPLMQLTPGVGFVGYINPYASTGETAIRAIVKIPAAPSGTIELLRWWTSGSFTVWTVEVVPGSPDRMFLRAYNSLGVEQLGGTGINMEADGPAGAAMYGMTLYLQIDLIENAGAINWAIYAWHTWSYGSGSGALDTGSEAASTVGTLEAIGSHNHSAAAAGTTLGHIAVASNANFATDPSAAVGFAMNSVSTRWTEIGNELDIFTDKLGSLADHLTYVGASTATDTVELFRELETAEVGVMFDGKAGFLTLKMREDRYNQAVALTLNRTAGEVDYLAPTDDDQQLRNDVTVSRPNGSQARSFDAAHIAANGTYATRIESLLADDISLPEHAAWHLHLGTVEEQRYPRIGINFTRVPALMASWLACDIGSRLQVTNPPAGQPPDTIDVHIEGYTEFLKPDEYRVELNCSPAWPWQVFAVEAAGNLGRLDTAGCLLAAAMSTVDTTMHVQTTAGPTWGTQTPYDLRVSGERVTVTAVASVVDTFTRSVSNGWGTSDFGLAWTTSGGSASDYSVTGTLGRHSHGSVNVIRETALALGYSDIDVTITSTISAAPTGDTVTSGVAARYVDSSNYVDVRIFRAAAGGVTIAARQVLAGVETVTSFPTVSGVTSSSSIKIRLQVAVGTLNGRAWLSTADEPTTWTVTLAVTHLTAGALRVHSVLGSAVSNTLPLLLDFDNLTVLDAQALTVTRSVNGAVKAQTVGTAVSLWNPGVLSL